MFKYLPVIMVAEEIIEELNLCRICLEEGCNKKLIKPCRCRGSMGGVHVHCLENWLNVKNIQKCEVCDDVYKIERILKYGRIRSILPYIRAHKTYILQDLLCLSIIFLLTMGVNYLVSFIQKKLLSTSVEFFVKFYFSVVWLYVNYFFFIEMFFDIYDIWVTWRTWRRSVFTIRIT